MCATIQVEVEWEFEGLTCHSLGLIPRGRGISPRKEIGRYGGVDKPSLVFRLERLILSLQGEVLTRHCGQLVLL